MLLRESDSMLARRRRENKDKTLPRLPGTIGQAGQLHHLRPHRLPGGNPHDQGAHHLAGPAGVPRLRDRRPIDREMANRNRLPAPEEDHQGHRAEPARPLTRPGPAGNLGAAAGAQHDRHARRPRHRAVRPGPGYHPVRPFFPDPRPRFAACSTCCPHCGKRPARADDPVTLLIAGILAQPRHRHRPARTSGRTPFQRQNWHTEPRRIHDHDHPVKSPANGHTSRKLRAVALHPNS